MFYSISIFYLFFERFRVDCGRSRNRLWLVPWCAFIENVSTYSNFLGRWIVAFIALFVEVSTLRGYISPTLGQAFVSSCQEYVRMRLRRISGCAINPASLFFVQADFVHSGCCTPVHEVHGHICSLCPIWLGHMLLVHHGPCYFEDVSILVFGYTILLRCVSASEFSLNSFLLEVCSKVVR